MKFFGTDVNLVSVWDVVQTLMGRRGHVASSEGKQEAPLKAGFMGISKNDEALFWDAVAQAFREENAVIARIKSSKIKCIFVELNHSQKKRLFQTVGINEQTVIETDPKSVEYTDGKGNVRQKIENKEKKYVANERGKRFIQFLASLEVAEAVAFLKASGTLTGPMDDLAHFWSVAKPFLVDTWNSIDARRRTQDAVLWYIGARTLEEAEVIVSARELALANRQGHTWYERNYGNRAYIWRWRILFATSIVALTYILTR